MKTLSRVAALALVSMLGLGGLMAQGQSPAPAGSAPSRMYTNKQQFRLPFKLDERERQKLREIQLYVKCGGETWSCRENAPAAQEAFVFRASQDGEYWFSIVTVDRSGRPTPADVTREPPALIVVVDTQKPDVQVTLVPSNGSSDDVLRCTVHDANPDPASVKLEYQTMEKTWRPLESMPGSPDQFRCPDRAVWNGVVRATATDLAQNTTTREISGLVAAAAPGAGRTGAEGMAPPVPSPVVAAPGLPPAPVGPSDMPSPVSHNDRTAMTQGTTADKAPLPAGPDMLPPPVHSPTLPSTNTSPTGGGSSSVSHLGQEALGGRQLINSTHAVLDYRIDQVGPSGVSRVEVYMTADEGKSWQKLCEDPDRRSPVEFDLPREGLFGLSVVVTNGNSISDPPPTPGTTPDWWIEVDMTRPTAQLQSVRPGNGDDAGSLIITWAASDKNLGTEPVDLYYAAKREGQWLPIARGLRNDGSYRWSVPKEGGPEYFVRLEVTDRAGNLTRCETPQAVVLDLQRPKAKVLGVSASAPRPLTPPTGN